MPLTDQDLGLRQIRVLTACLVAVSTERVRHRPAGLSRALSSLAEDVVAEDVVDVERLVGDEQKVASPSCARPAFGQNRRSAGQGRSREWTLIGRPDRRAPEGAGR